VLEECRYREVAHLVYASSISVCGSGHADAVFNADSTYDPVDLLEVIALLEDALGKKAEKRFLPMQPRDVAARCAE
jgi:nucleoside-diphosphate-sugar epimerase